MDSNELIKKVRKIEIKTRGLSQNIFAGEYHSAFKGRGMMFSEVREYQYGDDIRDIDWNVTARQNRPHVKVYEEERELTVMLLVDVSASRNFGAEKFITPKKGRRHILFLIRELLDFQPESKGTDIAAAVRYFSDALKRRCTMFLLSDFIDSSDYRTPLSVAVSRHDVMAIQVYDKRDGELPNIGLVHVEGPETGETRWVDTGSAKTRKAYNKWWYDRQQQMSTTLRSTRVDYVSVATDEDYVRALMGLFKNRATV